MSYHDLPDPRPVAVKYALGRMSRGAAVALMIFWLGVCCACAIGLCIVQRNPIMWGAPAIVAGLLAAQYFMAIRWVDFHKSWPRRRTYRKHRVTH